MGLFGLTPEQEFQKELDYIDEQSGPPPGFIEVERLSEPSHLPCQQQARQARCVRADDVREVTRLDGYTSQCTIRVVFGQLTELWWVSGSYEDLARKLRIAHEMERRK